jgi:hypothetical protein
MAEVLIQFETVVVADDGVKYYAQACAAPMPDGLWEGWIEFVPLEGGTPLRSPRETTQPNRRDAVYWASGLTPVYLAGALDRALDALVQKAVAPPRGSPLWQSPAGGADRRDPAARAGRAIVDPYAAYEKGEMLLRKELHAISKMHLVNVIRAYELSDESDAELSRHSIEALVDTIVSAVRRTPAR